MLFKMRLNADEAQIKSYAAKNERRRQAEATAVKVIENTVQPLIERAAAEGKSFVTFNMATTDDYYPFFEQILTENGYRVIVPILEDECSGYRGKLSVKIRWDGA